MDWNLLRSISKSHPSRVCSALALLLGACSATDGPGQPRADLLDGSGGFATFPGSGGQPFSTGGFPSPPLTGGSSSFVGSGGAAFGSGGAPPASGGTDPIGVGGTDPFGVGGADPFGTGGADPFGTGGADPFGTGGTDPIGMGGADPIGVGGTDPIGVGGTDPIGMGGTDPIGMGGAGPQAGGSGPGTGGSAGTGTCCADGDCLCHGTPPTTLSNRNGPFRTATVRMTTGTAHYPTNADPPFAGIAICPGFLNTGPEMTAWGTFYASYGIVTVVTDTLGGDLPDVRGRKLLAAIEELKRLSSSGSGPLAGKMAGRYGTSGYSMGGGGTTLATRTDKTLLTSVGLAAWGPNGTTIQTPTLLMCGESDIVAPCNGSQGAYNQIPNTTPKMLISIPLVDHLGWFGPNNTSGGYGLAFQKVFLEGDERWKPLLLQKPSAGSYTTNIR